MRHPRSASWTCSLWLVLLTVPAVALAQTAQAQTSLLPQRPLPTPRERPLSQGPLRYVDPRNGDDGGAGQLEAPWRTLRHAVAQLTPGQTLCLRGGVYYEPLVLQRSGEPRRPITICSHPGELAVIDGGLREFVESPADCWQPLTDGAPHEYVSVQRYPQFLERPVVHAFPAAGWEPFYAKELERPVVLGHFAESMVPLHGYRTLADLRDDSMLWDVEDKFDRQQGVYCGPGLWFNRETQRIHIRLQHTSLEQLGPDGYHGERDPRQVPLLISGPYGQDVLRINGVDHVAVEDLVIRGGSSSPLINLYGSRDVRLERVTAYGGSPTVLIKACADVRIRHSAFRGLAAPWSSRSSMKYRGVPSYSLISQRNQPLNQDVEIAWCEFTDNHDGLWVRYIDNLRFHHNLLDNFNDDGLEVGAKRAGHSIFAWQNRFSRCHLALTLHQMERGESAATEDEGSGVYLTRNVFDLRHGVFGSPPRPGTEGDASLLRDSSLTGDHGSPTWPNYYFYHNTVLRRDPSWRGYYGFGVGGRALRDSRRRLLNNLFIQWEGLPGLNFSAPDADVLAASNWHWSVLEGPEFQGDLLQTLGGRMAFRKATRPEHLMRGDRLADPGLRHLPPQWDAAVDLRPRDDSPLVDAGADVPADWPDPLRKEDRGRPDIGALPLGAAPSGVGVEGRWKLFGDP